MRAYLARVPVSEADLAMSLHRLVHPTVHAMGFVVPGRRAVAESNTRAGVRGEGEGKGEGEGGRG